MRGLCGRRETNHIHEQQQTKTWNCRKSVTSDNHLLLLSPYGSFFKVGAHWKGMAMFRKKWNRNIIQKLNNNHFFSFVVDVSILFHNITIYSLFWKIIYSGGKLLWARRGWGLGSYRGGGRDGGGGGIKYKRKAQATQGTSASDPIKTSFSY